MDIDKDIQQLITGIESGTHSITHSIDVFVDSLPGYNYRFRKKTTVDKYAECLKSGSNCLLKYMCDRGIYNVEEFKKEHSQQYKDFLLNRLSAQSVRSFMTATRLFLQYLFRVGWIKEDLSLGIRLPKPRKKEHIKILSREIESEVLNGEWGINSMAVARNNLIMHLFLKRGLHPKEFPTILEEHIHPYEDLAYITVFGKRDVPRDVMLDPETLAALKVHMVERAHFMYVKRIRSKYIFLSLNPHNDSYSITTSCVQGVIRRIQKELKLKGCLWDLSALNAQGCRRTAVSRDYEMAEDSPVHHPELTLSGQYGHSLEIAQKHYWRKSKRNAYRLIKGTHNMKEGVSFYQPPPPPKKDNLKDIYPDSSFFGDFGVGI